MRRSTRIFGYTAILSIVLVSAELASWGALKIIAQRGAGFLLFVPPRIDEEEWTDYLTVRDPLLGWPSVNALGGARYDQSGSRRAPANPEGRGYYITLYGDSFTYAEEVSDDDAWGNILAMNLRS